VAQEPSVTDRIGAVIHPLFEMPLAELGVIEHLEQTGSKVSVRLGLHAASERLQRQLRERIEEALKGTGIDGIGVDFSLRVPMRAAAGDDPVPQVKNVVLVMSGKGGVGKSTTAVNLTLALQKRGLRVGLLDADIYGPSIPTMLGINTHPQSADGKTIEPLSRFGVKLMSIGFMIENEKDAIIWRGPMLQSALMQFLSDVKWGELDFLLLDLPPGTGDVALSLAQKVKSTGAVIVTTPQEVALQDVYKSVSMCKKLNIPLLGVVENMSYFIDSAGVKHEIFGAGGGEKIAEFAEAPLLGQVPLDANVRQWGDGGTPIVQAAPEHPCSQAFLSIADALCEKIAKDSFVRGGGKKAPEENAPRRLKILR
jgi:ATP-binding protein involved in chromosome partitioning